MKTYKQAIVTAVDATVNMPNPNAYPSDFIKWAEDICIIIAEIYEKEYEEVVTDIQEYIGILEE